MTVELLVAIIASITGGTPAPLPALALGSAPLLYAERTVALFALLLLPLTILVRAFEGQLPVELRGMRWEEVHVARQETMIAVEDMREDVDTLKKRVRTLEVVAKSPGPDYAG